MTLLALAPIAFLLAPLLGGSGVAVIGIGIVLLGYGR
jgi:hypothetical protein